VISLLLAAAIVAAEPQAQAASSTPSSEQPTTIPEMWGAWCARCHALDGSGKVNEPTVSVTPMDFTNCSLTTPEPDIDWERAIAKGGPGVGLSSQMPAFEDSLSPEQIRGFVAHVRTFCAESRWPSGNLNFPRPILTEKAFPENEFLMLPVISHRKENGGLPAETEVEWLSVFERRIGRRAMYEVGLPILGRRTGALSIPSAALVNTQSSEFGLGDLELSFKYTLLASDTMPAILAAGLEAALPLANESKGFGHGTVMWEPFLTAGTTLGSWYLQAQTKVELPTDREKADRAFVYNLYLGRDTSLAPNTWTLGVELNGENHELAVTPQVRKGLTRTGALAAAVGVMIPVTEREEQTTRLVGYLLWEYTEPVRARK
jgi:mono/diheme cytochrome c family protein